MAPEPEGGCLELLGMMFSIVMVVAVLVII